MMNGLINNNYKGVSITIAVTGLPLLITGEVFEVTADVVGLRLRDNRSIYVEQKYIAFFY